MLGALAGLGGGLGLVGGLIGGFSGASGLRSHRNKLMSMYAPQFGSTSYNFGLAELYQKKTLDRIREGGMAAGKYIDRAGTLAKRGARDAGKQLMGSANQSAARRGLYNTTVLDSNRRAAVSDTQNLLDQVELSTGSARASLEERQAQAEAQALTLLSQLQIQRNAAELGIHNEKINTFASNYVPNAGEIIGGALGGAGGGLLGLAGLLGGQQ